MRKCLLIIILVFLATTMISINSNAASRTTVYNKGDWKVYLDSPDSAKSYYHLHFYKKGKHIYCLRLDNFKYCDGKKNKDKVPTKVYEAVMSHSKVKKAVLYHNPNVKKSASYKAVIKAGAVTIAAILVILAALNVFTGVADDAVAWAAFLKAISM